MNDKNEIANKLFKASRELGIAKALHSLYGGGVRVKIPFGKNTADTPIDELELSVRASNCLHRAGHNTVAEVIEAINQDALSRYRNVGRKTVSEIKTKILILGYSQLNDIEKLSFCREVVDRNFGGSTESNGML